MCVCDSYTCSHFPIFVADKCNSTEIFVDDLSIKIRHCTVFCLARDRRMGVADLCKACSDWLTVKNVGLQLGEMSTTNLGDVLCVGDDKCRRCLSADTCKQRLMTVLFDILHIVNA